MSDSLISGIDVEDLSSEIRPQDDLFHHVNERWIERTPIPPDKASYGTFMRLFEDVRAGHSRASSKRRGRAEASSEARKFGDLYDELHERRARRTSSALSRLRDDLALVDAVTSIPEFIRVVGAAPARRAVGLLRRLRRQRSRQSRALPGLFRTRRHLAARRELLPRRALRLGARGVRRCTSNGCSSSRALTTLTPAPHGSSPSRPRSRSVTGTTSRRVTAKRPTTSGL